jgi:methanogenic corrinoid protein MtbC1
MDRMPQDNAHRAAADAEAGYGEGHPMSATAEAALVAPGAWFGGGARGPTAEERLARLVRTIEADIIPRLVHAHRAGDLQDTGTPSPKGDRRVGEIDSSLDARAYAQLVLGPQESAWVEPIERLRDGGCSIESICLDLLGPAARELGDLWTRDLCSFSDVTIGTGRLQQLIRTLNPQLSDDVDASHDGRRALLLPAPGEQHTFGITIVADFFVRDGWEVVGGMARPGLDAVDLVEKEWFDVVGFSVGHVARIAPLAMMVRQIRQVSRNRAIGVLAGGPALIEHPEAAQRLGVDGTASDGREALRVAERLLGERVKRRP